MSLTPQVLILIRFLDILEFALKNKSLQPFDLQAFIRFVIILCDPAGIRTQDHYIKSVMLYQLSYGIKVLKELPLSVSF